MGDILKDGQSTLQEKTNFFDMKKDKNVLFSTHEQWMCK